MKKLSFPIFWEWVLACSRPITYDTQLELFCLLFDAYSVETDKHYTAVQVSRYASGKEHLPRRMVSKYWLVENYISDLEEAVLTVLIPAIPDLPGAIDQLICIVGEDDTLTRRQRCILLEGCNADGGEATAAWVAYILRYAMLMRSDSGIKAA